MSRGKGNTEGLPVVLRISCGRRTDIPRVTEASKFHPGVHTLELYLGLFAIYVHTRTRICFLYGHAHLSLMFDSSDFNVRKREKESSTLPLGLPYIAGGR